MNTVELKLNDVEVFFLKRALAWRIQNIDYFIEKKGLEGLKKANQLSEKSTLMNLADRIEQAEQSTESYSEDGAVGNTVAVADPPEEE